jgi:hypothetical protein
MPALIPIVPALVLSLSAIQTALVIQDPATAEAKRVRWATAPAGKSDVYRVPRMKANTRIDADWNKSAWKDVAALTLKYYMGTEPTHQPKVQAKVAYDDHDLYVIWKVEDQYVLAKRMQHMQDVYRDSCVEFFFTPGGAPKERGYFNLETNCTGVKLFSPHVPGRKNDKLSPEDFASVVTASSLKGPVETEIGKPTSWTLEYKIPLGLLEKFSKVDHPAPGVAWRANFYKCADESSHPHWLTWRPIAKPMPSFHLPEYFGTLLFE